MPVTQPTVLQWPIEDPPLRVLTRPGFAEWDAISPALSLLAEGIRWEAGQCALVAPCGHGALGAWAARHLGAGQVGLADTNMIAAEMARQTLDANGLGAARVLVGLPEALGQVGSWDLALCPLPKGRDLTRLYLLQCARALRPGGRLYLAGLNREGIKSAADDATLLFGPGRVLGYKGGGRALLFIRPERLPDPLPAPYTASGMAEGIFSAWEEDLPGGRAQLVARPGVFSRHSVDAGTRLLLDTLTVRPDECALDVGCGYGAIGLTLARLAPRGQVELVDADWLAVQCAQETLRRNGIVARVTLGDGPLATGRADFTLIASNPPFHAGHAVDTRVAEGFVEAAWEALLPLGRLVIVANRFLAYHRAMEARFGDVETLVQTPQYRVLAAIKPRKPKRAARQRAARQAQALLDEDDDDWDDDD